MKNFFEVIGTLLMSVCVVFTFGFITWYIITTYPVWAVILSFVFISVSSIAIYNEDKNKSKKMKHSCKKFYDKMVGTYEFEGPDKHHKHRRKLKKAYKTILRKRLNKLIDNGEEKYCYNNYCSCYEH